MHFLLNDAMFQRCFEKNIDLDVFDDVYKKKKNIVLTMHISDVFGKKYFKQIEIYNKSYEICDKLW